MARGWAGSSGVAPRTHGQFKRAIRDSLKWIVWAIHRPIRPRAYNGSRRPVPALTTGSEPAKPVQVQYAGERGERLAALLVVEPTEAAMTLRVVVEVDADAALVLGQFLETSPDVGRKAARCVRTPRHARRPRGVAYHAGNGAPRRGLESRVRGLRPQGSARWMHCRRLPRIISPENLRSACAAGITCGPTAMPSPAGPWCVAGMLHPDTMVITDNPTR